MLNPDLNAALAILAVDYNLIPEQFALDMIDNTELSEEDMLAQLSVFAKDTAVVAAISEVLGVPFADLSSTDNLYNPSVDLASQVDKTWLQNNLVLPTTHGDDPEPVFVLANARANADAVAYLRSVYGPNIAIAQGLPSQIISELVKLDTGTFGSDSYTESTPGNKNDSSAPVRVKDSPVVAWLDNLFARAVAENASDVHFLSQEDGSLLVRFRVDGILRPQIMPLKGREGEVIGSLLTRCPTIDPSDRTRPQDGSFSFRAAEGRQIDTRLAMLPQVHGPIIVVRLLDPLNVRRKLDTMGFASQTLETIREVTRQPQGLILIIGPTGSGKTTTLYAVLNELDAIGKNILTAEDPVEYRLPNIGQTQIRSDLGDKSLTFARAARAFLRLDPDIILVGEIRDSETSDIVMHAALTGHLVLSTIHANSALGVFTRLEELGGEPFMVAESLALAVSQRLIGRVHDCKEVAPPTPAQAAFLERMGLRVPDLVANARGCNACSGTGYKGRIPVMEVLRPTEKVRELVATKAPSSTVTEAVKTSGGWTSILEDALRHVEQLESTVEEMLRVLNTGEIE